MNLDKEIIERMRGSARVISENIEENVAKIREGSERIASALRRGNRVLFFGNGGSAAEAQHFAAEFVNRMLMNRAPLSAIALTTDSSVLTSIGNDRSFEDIFSVQIEALGREGDIAVGISTSGNSRNVIKGLKKAKEKGLYRIGLAGNPGTGIGEECDLCFWVRAESTPRIQEVHLLVGHLICEMVELILFGERD